MDVDQIDILDLTLKILAKPDWSYSVPKSRDDVPTHDQAVERVFHALYGRPIDKDTCGVHWLARIALLHAISHVGYFTPKTNYWKWVFWAYAFGSGILGYIFWRHLAK